MQRAGFEPVKNRAIHFGAVRAEPRSVVVHEVECDKIQIAQIGRNGIVELAGERNDVPESPALDALGQSALHEILQHESIVLRVHQAAFAHRTREQLGVIPGARTHIEHVHARPHTVEHEQFFGSHRLDLRGNV